MAELGQTQDPQQLVPGKPEAIEENARVLHARADRANWAGDGLQEIDTGAWQGPGAQAFHDKFSYEPGKWFAAGDALESAASALDDYASTLRWAQAQAVEAIALWNQGQNATQQAKAAHEAAAAQAATQNQPAPPFTDPGESSRQAAQGTLNRARAQLSEAGDLAAQLLRSETEGAPEDSNWLDDLGNFCANVGAHIVNDLASFGNAILHHPGDVVAALGGLGLTVASATGEFAGVVLSATGVGAAAGAPAIAISTTGLAAGIGTMTAAIGDLASHAGGDDRVEPVKPRESSTAESSTPNAGNGRAISREELTPSQESNLNRYQKKLPAAAEQPTITRLEDGSVRFVSKVPGRVPGSYAEYTKTVGPDGTTIGYTKTTHLPDGSIAHIKDKMQ
ncbi:putative T7SS-secreted protein [Amycolatopsis taiwanensis]|uniref:Putative T7SS secretion signal domain-containing protein n=1 Tax=Amycolatopsis taiwanensis TaxID=342230 RepID=A0A9W6VI11_9PSEU|nr:hypothetical protein [Amycolatopsis taiwanensis]GLY67957.1 hypothetical protein Atai01_45760 [Amycolatopsis taiwanensis]